MFFLVARTDLLHSKKLSPAFSLAVNNSALWPPFTRHTAPIKVVMITIFITIAAINKNMNGIDYSIHTSSVSYLYIYVTFFSLRRHSGWLTGNTFYPAANNKLALISLQKVSRL